MSQSSAVARATLRLGAAVGVGWWIAVSFACSDATPSRTPDQTVNSGIQGGDGGAPSADDAGTEDAADEGPHPPMYNGAPGATEAPMQSGSIAAPDGSCPIPDSLAKSGGQCPSCATSHCASALSECDPTMVSACTEYYCPKQCVSPDAAAASACPILASCCPTLLFGTLLYSQCYQAQTGGVPSTCASFLTQAQGSGHCN